MNPAWEFAVSLTTGVGVDVVNCQSASQAQMTDKAAWTPFQMVVSGFYGASRQRRRGNLEIILAVFQARHHVRKMWGGPFLRAGRGRSSKVFGI